MKKTEAAICDSNRRAAARCSEILREAAEENGIELSVSVFGTAEQLLYETADSPNRFQILYTNILLGKTDGLRLARQLRASHCNTEIIFMAAGPQFTFESFAVRPLTFLDMITVTEAEFKAVFLRAVNNFTSGRNALFPVKTASSVTEIPVREIEYFEYKNRLVTVSFGNRLLWFHESLPAVEKQLADAGFRFIRSTPFFLVNPRQIERIENGRLILFSGQNIPISISAYNTVRNQFQMLLAERKETDSSLIANQ